MVPCLRWNISATLDESRDGFVCAPFMKINLFGFSRMKAFPAISGSRDVR